MTGQRQLKPKEKMLLLILLNENKPVSVHKLSHITGTTTQKTLQHLYNLSNGFRLLLTTKHEAEIIIKTNANDKINDTPLAQKNLFEDNKHD